MYRRLPQFDRVALGVDDAGETAGLRRIPFGTGFDGDTGRCELRHEGIEIIDAEIDHPLLVGREIIGGGRERGEDGDPCLLTPEIGDAEMVGIPLGQSLGVLGAEEDAANAVAFAINTLPT